MPGLGIVDGFKAWSLLIYLVLVPFVERNHGYVVPILFFLMLFFVLDTLGLRPRVYRTAVGVGFTAMVLHLIGNTTALRSDNAALLGRFIELLYLVFVAFCIIILAYKIFGEDEVRPDTVKGGLAVYFLAGLGGAILYDLLIFVQPGALSGVGEGAQLSSLIYFSFVTMTTLGFGDITPQTPLLRTVVYLQAALGQVYLAVLVARLVGLLGVSRRKD
jgi:hypothetical protein